MANGSSYSTFFRYNVTWVLSFQREISGATKTNDQTLIILRETRTDNCIVRDHDHGDDTRTEKSACRIREEETPREIKHRHRADAKIFGANSAKHNVTDDSNPLMMKIQTEGIRMMEPVET